MNDDLDTLLSQDLLKAPSDFSYRVMQGIKPLPMPFEQVRRPKATATGHALRQLAFRLGVVSAGLLGLSQVLGFVFGVWISATAL